MSLKKLKNSGCLGGLAELTGATGAAKKVGCAGVARLLKQSNIALYAIVPSVISTRQFQISVDRAWQFELAQWPLQFLPEALAFL